MSSSKVSLVFSAAALAVSVTTLWFSHFRDVNLEVAIGPDLFISNESGGIPDARISFALRGAGPDERALVISRIEATLTRKTTGQKLDLRNSREAKYPKILKGKEVQSEAVLLVVNDYVSDEVRRNERWCDDLLAASPEQRESIDRLRRMLVGRFIPRTDGDEGGDREDAMKLAQKIIASIPQEKLDRVIFISSGVYELEVRFVDPDGSALAVSKATFTIDELLAKSTRANMLSRKRVQLIPVV
ncbi:MAG: hypothetical protein KIT17_28235 [Rubrivivax sp.]|nr:hypothetical protein [Rubrivivax sp.]